MTLATIEQPITGVVLMTPDEARETVNRIRAHFDGARRLLLDLHERDGWRALGYSSWRACAVEEFGQSQAHVYRQLQAAEIERDLGSPIGEMRESVLRPLAQIETPEQRRMLWEEAQQSAPGGKLTAAHVAATVAAHQQPDLLDVSQAVQLESIFLELSRLGWDRVGGEPRTKSMTKFYELRSAATHEEKTLAEGEISYFLEDVQRHAQYREGQRGLAQMVQETLAKLADAINDEQRREMIKYARPIAQGIHDKETRAALLSKLDQEHNRLAPPLPADFMAYKSRAIILGCGLSVHNGEYVVERQDADPVYTSSWTAVKSYIDQKQADVQLKLAEQNARADHPLRQIKDLMLASETTDMARVDSAVEQLWASEQRAEMIDAWIKIGFALLGEV